MSRAARLKSVSARLTSGCSTPGFPADPGAALNSQTSEHPMQQATRADRQAPSACAHEPSSSLIADRDNSASAPVAPQMNRRTVVMNTVVSLASLASASAVAAPVNLPEVTTSEPDPIFAAIERHRRAFPLKMKAILRRAREADAGPNVNDERLAQVTAQESEACREEYEAAWALTTIQPTTLAGITALIRYVEDFNAGKVGGNEEAASSPFWWPSDEFDEEEHPIDRFPYDILANVRAALAAMSERRATA